MAASALDRLDVGVAAIVLAGGRSRRFGRDKAAAELEGRSLLERVLDALRPICGAGLFVVGGEPARPAALGARFVEDTYPGEGPLGGLLCGAAATDAPWLFVVACDMPLLSPELVGHVARARAEGDDLVVPTTARGDEPLAALYGRRAVDALRGAFDAGVRRLQPFPEALRVRRLDADALPRAEGLRGANTEAELAALRETLRVLESAEVVESRERSGPPRDSSEPSGAPATARGEDSPGRTLGVRISALAGDEMRRAGLRGALLAMTPETAAESLEALLVPDAPRAPGTAKAAAAAIALFTLGEGLPYDFAARMYEVAAARGYETVRRLLLRGVAQRTPAEGQLTPDPRLGRHSLGERKFLARKADPNLIDRLLFDPDPTVLRNLLRNPRMTEREALRIASHRPGSAEVLRLLAADPRFGRRERVRRALVRNPYTPSDLAANLVAFLVDRDLREIASDELLHESVREAAASVLRMRHGKS